MTSPDAPVAPAGGGYVMTVTGPVAPESLGLTLPHEHLIASFDLPTKAVERAAWWGHAGAAAARAFFDAPLAIEMLGEVSLGAPNRDDRRLAATDVAASELRAFAASGGGTIVDVTTADRGRDPAALLGLARSTGLNIVMGAGLYRPPWFDGQHDARAGAGDRAFAGTQAPCPATAGSIVAEIQGGLAAAGESPAPGIVPAPGTVSADGTAPADGAVSADGTVPAGGDGPAAAPAVAPVRAGVIGEIAALNPHLDPERAYLEAIAHASRDTGAAILMTRFPDPATQQRALDVLEKAGADLARVALTGCDPLAPHPNDLEPVLHRGVSIAFDRLGRLPSALSVNDDHDVIRAVIELDRRGWRDRLLLSHSVSRKHHLLAWGGGGYEFLAAQLLPLARMMYGMDAGLIEAVTVANPRRLLTINGADA